MKFFLYLILLVSCVSQNPYVYKLNKFIEIKQNDSVLINNKNYIFFRNDVNLYNQFISHVCIEKTKNSIHKFDSIESTPYNAYFYEFKSTKNELFVFFWENQYEFFSITNAYFYYKNKILKIGEFNVFIKNQYNDYYRFPIHEILINQKNNLIEFKFSKDVLINVGEDDEITIKANKTVYIYDIKLEKLIFQFQPK